MSPTFLSVLFEFITVLMSPPVVSQEYCCANFGSKLDP
jgi:hypothetical protein